MATMKLYELVNHYHIGTELTCAEAMFMACNEYYHLNLSEETRKMFSVMGLGMQTEQSCCGAFTVAVGIIGLMTAKEGQTDVNNIEPTTGGSFFRMLTDDLRLNTGLLDTFLPLIKAHYLDFIDRFEADPVEALQPVCAPFTEAEDYSWFIYVREQMVEQYGTAEQMEEYRRQAELRGTPECKAKTHTGKLLFYQSHAKDVDHAWASSRTKEELDQVVEPFVQAKRQTGQWTQEDEAGYQLYRQETDPEKRTFRVWYLIANPRSLPKEFVQKELEFRWKLFPEKKEETK